MEILSVTKAQGRIGHCKPQSEATLLDCLAVFGISRERAEHLIALGAVYHECKRIRSDRLLSAGEYVRVHLYPKRFPVESIDWTARVVHIDDDFVLVNKPAGIPVHPTVDNYAENVVHQMSLALGLPLFVTQRLDNEVGGLLVLAKTRAFQRKFNQLLAERRIKKRYRALVNSAPATGQQVHYMKPSERSPKTVQSEPNPEWQRCVLTIDGIRKVGSAGGSAQFEVDIDLETGRTHQIRAQLSALGSPIDGDALYGSTATSPGSGIALFSSSISWVGADGKRWAFTARPWWDASP